MIDDGVVGMTSNPTIFQKAISAGGDYDKAVQAMVSKGEDALAIYDALTVKDVGDAADLLRPVYDRTDGLDGYVSLEVDPHLAHDTEGTVKEGRRLFGLLNRPNIFIKVPATEEGMPAVETLIGEGINVNVTLIFSLVLYRKVMEAYIRGIESRIGRGEDVSKVASVASFFVSRVDSLTDKKLQAKIDAGGNEAGLRALMGKAAIGNAKCAYAEYKTIFHGERFAKARSAGARVQRPLWASTSTKNPDYPDTYYVDNLIGAETVNTLPLNTIAATLDHGTAAVTIEDDLQAYRDAIAKIEAAGVGMNEVTGELLAAGVKSFADSFDLLMSDIRAKMDQLQTA